MSFLNYFKNTPSRPPIGQQDLSVIFFLQICKEVPGKKRSLSPLQRATGACRPPPRATSGRARPRARQGPVAPSAGDRGASRPPRATGVSPPI